MHLNLVIIAALCAADVALIAWLVYRGRRP